MSTRGSESADSHTAQLGVKHIRGVITFARPIFPSTKKYTKNVPELPTALGQYYLRPHGVIFKHSQASADQIFATRGQRSCETIETRLQFR